jgi:hypothetical protein
MKYLFLILFTVSLNAQILPSQQATHYKKSSGGSMPSPVTFTNCSSVGKDGPSQSDCNTAYSGTSLEGDVTVSNGIQEWTVPYTGNYTIEAWGAKGGGITYNCNFSGVDCHGANGARMKGTFSLNQGEIIRIAVGQMGEDHINSINGGGGGGGGSFVAKGSNHSSAFPLIIAGGGGGGHRYTYTDYATIPGQITESGLGNTTNWTSGAAEYGPGSGGSWSSDGENGSHSCCNSTNNSQGGKGWANFLVGGLHSDPGFSHWSLGDGGFGGGAGGAWGGGPGGGYNGGPRVKAANAGQTRGGSGGGSYNSGTSADNTAGAWNSHGKVTITQI